MEQDRDPVHSDQNQKAHQGLLSVVAEWTEASVHPKTPEKNLKIYKRENDICFSYHRGSIAPQSIPRLKTSACSRETAQAFFGFIPDPHWSGPLISSAVALAIATNSAVQLPATLLIGLYLASIDKVAAPRDHKKNYDANRQSLVRRGKPASASEILRIALKEMKLDGHAQVAVNRNYTAKGATHVHRRMILILPHSDCAVPEPVAEQLLYELSTGVMSGKTTRLCGKEDWIRLRVQSADEYGSEHFDNHVERYMRKNITSEMLKPSIEEAAALKLIDIFAGENARTSLRSSIRRMYANGFSCHYRANVPNERMFGVGNGLQTLPAFLRRALFPGFVELDFSNMHLALANQKLNLGIDLEKSFWLQLAEEQQPIIDSIYLTLEGAITAKDLKKRHPQVFRSTPSNTDISFDVNSKYLSADFLKKHRKTATYAILYGKSASAQVSGTAADLRKEGVESPLALVIARMICRSPLIAGISAKMSAFCNTNKITASDLSHIFQQQETTYVRYLYTIADEMGPKCVRIPIHSHDGVSLQFSDIGASRKFFAEINSRLYKQLAVDNINTKLEAVLSSGKKLPLSELDESTLVFFGKSKMPKAPKTKKPKTLRATPPASARWEPVRFFLPKSSAGARLFPWPTGPPG